MFKILSHAALLLATSVVVSSCSESPESGSDSGLFTPLTEVLEYRPAPGQFVLDSYWDNCDLAYDRLSVGEYLSLGGWGGFVSVSFGAKVLNGEGGDIAIKGNQFATSNEPGVVWVSVDVNGNGECDDVWYELRGSESSNSLTQRNHTKIYEGVDYTFSGTLLPSNVVETSTDYWTMTPFEWGYVDNMSDLDYEDGYNLFDIDNAVDANGDAVTLAEIDFVKVQCGVDAYAGDLGEVSTEVLHFKARIK